MRGGQITIFFLVGLAVLLVFIMLLVLRRTLTQDFIEPQALTSQYDTQLIKGYVESCMDIIAEEAFLLLGRQGGLLFLEQGGLSPHNPQLEATIHILDASGSAQPAEISVGFGLVKNSGFPWKPPYTSPPAYPFLNTPLANLLTTLSPWNGFQYDGAFGQFALPKLCDPEGANNQAAGNTNLACPTELFPLPGPVHRTTVQESFEAYMEQGLLRCLAIEELAARLGAEVTAPTPNVSMILTQSETVVDLTLPLTFVGERSTLQVGTFTRNYPVRLFKVYNFIFHLLNATGKNPYFSINDSADYSGLEPYDTFTVTRQPLTITAAGREDLSLVTVTDSSSRVARSTWFFQFLQQNRAPILDEFPLQLAPGLSSQAALDPDGDTLEFTLRYPDGTVSVLTSTPNPPYASVTIPGGLPAGDAQLFVEDGAGYSDWQAVLIP